MSFLSFSGFSQIQNVISEPIHSVSLGNDIYMFSGRGLMFIPQGGKANRQLQINTPKLITNIDSFGALLPNVENPVINVTITAPGLPGPTDPEMRLYSIVVNNTAYTNKTEFMISIGTNPAKSLDYKYYCDYTITGKVNKKNTGKVK